MKRILVATAALGLLAGCVAACTASDILTVEQNAVPCAQAIQPAVAKASDNVSKGMAAAEVASTNPACVALGAAAATDIAKTLAKGGTVQTASAAPVVVKTP